MGDYTHYYFAEFKGVAEMSISSVLSGSGVGRAQWVQLLQSVDRAVTGVGVEQQQFVEQNKVEGEV